MVATSYHIYHHHNYGPSPFLSFFFCEQEKQMSLVKQNTAGIKSSLGLKLTPANPFHVVLLIHRLVSQPGTGYA
jgi:hypothetical protein